MQGFTRHTASWRTLRSGAVVWSLAGCFLVSAALYTAFFTPAVRHFSSSIPYSSYAGERDPIPLEQGDHLQLLYHFDLFKAYLCGELPWFRNLWEFNTSDADRPARFDTCYAPFALPYSVMRIFGATDAFAWNCCQFLAVFLGVAFCYALARRYGASRAAALSIAAVSSCVPYRWVVLSGGSPTGFGMGLVPAIALGIDIAVRDRKAAGGLLAAAAIAACYAADLHCYLFGALSVPLWIAIALLVSRETPISPPQRFREIAIALSPVVAAGAATAALGTWAKRAYAATDVSGGRTLAQISVHSPDWHAFFDPFYFSHSPEQFHMGVFLPALLAVAGLVAALRIAFPRSARRRGAAAAALVMACAIVFAFFLAMGVNGPMDGLPLRIVRKLVPPFRMVRQPLKVFCLLPTLYNAFFAASFAGLRSPPGRVWRALRIAAFLAIPCTAFVSVSRGMHLGLCALPGKNAAYETVVECAQRRGDAAPRAIALPIWPGDSSWSSIYQYCASKSGLRMVNGYAAVVNMDYFENVFRAFETMTEGEITDAMLEKLRAMGASAVILHENAFPAKVSPFPFGVTLRRFLADRRLRLLASGGGAWAFEIKDAAEVESETPAPDPTPSFFQPSRAFALCPPSTNAAVRIRSFSPIHANGFGWLVRAGDGGRLVLSATAAGPDGTRRIGETLVFDEPAQPHGVAVGHRLAWLPACPAGPDLKTGLETPGSAIITHVAYTAEQYWNIARKDNGSLEIPVCDMAHRAGETVVEPRENKSGGTSALQPCALEFRPLSFRPGEVVFGPQLPLPFEPDSILEARLKADTPGADGTDGAALWISAVDGGETIATIPSGSKRPNGLVFRYDGTSPVCFHLSAEPHDRPERLRAVEIYVRTPSRAP